MPRLVISAIILCFCSPVLAGDFTYQAIAERYGETQLDAKRVKEAKMQGECLVGLKQLNFQKRDDFDPVAEWTNYRSLSLLEQFPPCTVLIMVEVARKELVAESRPK
jgi:hypothetical protein|tara:strand:- start:7722 stop:8042 length:321 start_codon:yes stop_codon:yes gene_type:complete